LHFSKENDAVAWSYDTPARDGFRLYDVRDINTYKTIPATHAVFRSFDNLLYVPDTRPDVLKSTMDNAELIIPFKDLELSSPQQLAISPDGRYLAAVTEILPTTLPKSFVLECFSLDRKRRVWRLAIIEGSMPGFTSDGEFIAVNNKLVSTKDGSAVSNMPFDANEWFPTNSARHILGRHHSSLTLVDLATRRIVYDAIRCTSKAISSDGNRLAIGLLDSIMILKVPQMDVLWNTRSSRVREVALSPNGRWLAAMTDSGLRLFAIDEPQH
jgi:WD40 repeat protein